MPYKNHKLTQVMLGSQLATKYTVDNVRENHCRSDALGGTSVAEPLVLSLPGG